MGATFLVLPLAALLLRVPWASLGELLSRPDTLAALRLSILTSTAATLVALVTGVPLALLLARSSDRRTVWVRPLVTVPLLLPPVVGGLALLLAYGRRGVVGGPLGIELPFTTLAVVVAETFVAMPFLVLTVEGALRTAGEHLEEVAATLGSTPLNTFLRVTLPAAGSSLAAGSILCWARAMGEFGATITFAGNLPGKTQTMPLAAYQAFVVEPDAAIALSVIMLVMCVGLLVLMRGRWVPGVTRR